MSKPPPEIEVEVDDVDDGPVVRPFADWIREQSRGETHDEISEALHVLAQRVRDTRKKGTVTLVIEMAPFKGDREALMVSDQIKLKLPEYERQSSVFFTDKQGRLTREDPNQPTFDSLREVGGGKPRTLRDGTPKEKQA